MAPTQALVDSIYSERVKRARATAPEDKLMDGFLLFEESRRWALSGIRAEFPDVDAVQAEQIFLERLNRLRRRDEQDLYRPLEVSHDEL